MGMTRFAERLQGPRPKPRVASRRRATMPRWFAAANLRGLPADRGAAIVATGGLSHQVHGERADFNNPEWDAEFMDLLELHLERPVAMTHAEYATRGGLEGASVIMWLVMRSAMAERLSCLHRTYYLPSMAAIATAIYEHDPLRRHLRHAGETGRRGRRVEPPCLRCHARADAGGIPEDAQCTRRAVLRGWCRRQTSRLGPRAERAGIMKPRRHAMPAGTAPSPARTPAAVIALLYREINHALASPAPKTRLDAEGAEAAPGAAEGFGTMIAQEIARWKPGIEQSRMQPE
jgi:hypothetical protein